MTLRGSFQDLSLAEVLQLASLTGSSAVLSLRSPEGSAWIGLVAGAVMRVARDDDSFSAPKLLGRTGFDGELGARTAGEVIREAVFAALVDLFEWSEGDFHLDSSLDPRTDWPGPEGAILDPAVSVQVLTLEVARQEHEREGDEPVTAPDDGRDSGARTRPCALVAIGPDLARLEALKATAVPHVHPTHIFQLPEDGVRRVGQYLAQGRFPLVIVDAGAEGWPEAASWTDVSERLRGVSPLIRIVALTSGGSEPCPWIDAEVVHPASDEELLRLLGDSEL